MMSGFARLATVSALGVYLLIVFGAVVRVTGSGLGCPDWPLCHGRLIPPAELSAIIEYLHRSVAVLVGLPLAALFAATWLRQRQAATVFRAVNLLMLLLIPQILLGREVVLRELPPPLVAVHLANALLIMALAILTAAEAAFGPGTPMPSASSTRLPESRRRRRGSSTSSPRRRPSPGR